MSVDTDHLEKRAGDKANELAFSLANDGWEEQSVNQQEVKTASSKQQISIKGKYLVDNELERKGGKNIEGNRKKKSLYVPTTVLHSFIALCSTLTLVYLYS